MNESFMNEQESKRLTQFADKLLTEMGADPHMEVRDALNVMAGYAFRCGVIYCEEHAKSVAATRRATKGGQEI